MGSPGRTIESKAIHNTIHQYAENVLTRASSRVLFVFD